MYDKQTKKSSSKALIEEFKAGMWFGTLEGESLKHIGFGTIVGNALIIHRIVLKGNACIGYEEIRSDLENIEFGDDKVTLGRLRTGMGCTTLSIKEGSQRYRNMKNILDNRPERFPILDIIEID